MKKIATLLVMLFVLCGVQVMAQTDYYVAHGADVNVSHSTHYPKTISIVGTQSEEQVLTNIASAIHCPAYFDKTSTIFEVLAGDLVTPNIIINGAWMHGYVYVDWNNNKQFDVNIQGDGPYTKGDNNELMCWSLYSKNGNGDTGWNSDGAYQSNGNVLAPGSFYVPADLEVGSIYRMRYKVEWNSIDPAGSGDKFLTDGGAIIDVMLKIAGKATKVEKYPLNDYKEPRIGTTPDAAEWNALNDGLQASWGTRDDFYSLHEVPQHELKTEATIHAWKGERANIQAVLFSKTDEGMLSVRMTEWRKNGVATGVNAGDARFVNYVITDDFKACGNHPSGLQTWLVADVIDQDKPHAVPAMETRPVWCTLEIPRNVEAGAYTTELEVVDEAGNVVKSLKLNVNVNAHSLPEVKDQKFHLDFWQQPYSVSRYYEVERWSDEHIEALRPYLAALGRAGQRTVSAIMFYEPWGEQTHDLFDPMVQTVKKKDGSWAYDYSIFDKYVALCAEYGIDKQINCFSMVPWDMNFRYWDEATGTYKNIQTTTGTAEYRNLWNSFLTAFKAHLLEKGWFEKTNIAMDERAEADMLNAYNIASALGFNMALAGNYHSSLSDKLQDFCVALGQDKKFTAEQRADRKAKNRVTTFYTSCADAEPNIYTNSFPAEATFLPIYAAANDLSGYLHWAWINWDEHPLTDSRYRKFGSGDTYCYYPGNRSSVRFERLIEGIHQYEKIQILKEEYKDNPEKMKQLNTLLKRFESHAIVGEECAPIVNNLEDFLNGLEVEIPVATDVATGYYHLVSRATSRTEHLYNNALLNGNNYRFTLQSNTMVNTNNGIWYVTVKDGGKLGVKNGDGNSLVAGASNGGSVVGTFDELTIGTTTDVGEYRYYYFTEALNCTNGGANFKVSGVDFVTTWTSGGATVEDNQWRFEPVDVENKFVYDVKIVGNEGLYVTYTNDGVVEYAFDGGFLITDKEILVADLKVNCVDNVVGSAEIVIENGEIRVASVTTGTKPVKQDLYNTSKGDGVKPPYRIPGITTASNGRLITAAARLVCGTDPGYGQVDIVCRTSDDHGATWSDMIDVAVGNGITSATENYFETAFGDPAIVADRTSSEVLIIAVAGCTVYGNGNTTRQNPNLVATIHSMDNGETWETPVNATEQIYSLFDSGNPIQSAFVAGGKIFQSRIVKKDKYYRLYAAMCARPNGNRVIYSDDFGRTWKALGGPWALPAPGGDEPKCEELPDGRVILSSRVGGGRIYNIYTYTNTLEGTGEWSTDVKSTFEGSGLTPGGNSTNGEILVVPVVRNSDNKEMYLALQSLPTGSGRTNVSIFYKELADFADISSVANLAADWNGYYQVSNTSSAYSSMDLQADNRIGFIYEETLTGFGRRDNPVSTSFPNGEGQHNFDGFDNIYVAYELEYITNGAYSVKNDISRLEYVKQYFNALAENAEISSDLKTEVKAAVDNLTPELAVAEVDNIYALLSSEKPADPWDGKYLTFTSVQQSGREFILYVKSKKSLAISKASLSRLGETAEFLCKKEESGRYSFYNEDAQMYMIWRAGSNLGYNNNLGVMSEYNPIYCDWGIEDGSSAVEGTHYIISKRANGDSGSLVITSTGTFDAWSTGIGYAAGYSNLFRINVNEYPTSIEGVENNAEVKNNHIYDISGRRVKNPNTGFYIVNGKKKYVK